MTSTLSLIFTYFSFEHPSFCLPDFAMLLGLKVFVLAMAVEFQTFFEGLSMSIVYDL